MRHRQSGESARQLARRFDLALRSAREGRSKEAAEVGLALREVRRAMIRARRETPPVDLEALARSLGVRAVVSVPLAAKGRVLVQNGALRVELNRDLAGLERRLTLAHELAHVIVDPVLGDPGRVSVQSRAPTTHQFERLERLCDVCAEEIIVPRAWLAERLDPTSPDLEVAKELGTLADCPLEFIARRAIATGLWSGRLLWCERLANSYRVVDTYPGMESRDLFELSLGDLGSELVGRPLHRRSFVVPRLPIETPGGLEVYRSQWYEVSAGQFLIMLVFGRS